MGLGGKILVLGLKTGFNRGQQWQVGHLWHHGASEGIALRAGAAPAAYATVRTVNRGIPILLEA
jgi:hypothetical protein